MLSIENNSEDCFVVYQGHQGNSTALKADLILPGAAYTEKESTFLNVEGRAQKTQKILSAPGKAKEDVSVLSAICKCIVSKEFDSKIADIEEYNTVNDNFF